MMEESNTPLDASAANWLSNLEMDEHDLLCPLNLLDVDEEEFLSHDIASALQEPTLPQSLSSECTDSSTDETNFDFDFDFDFERPSKLLKTTISTSYNSSIITNLSPSCSFSSFQSQILSFDNPISSSSNDTHFYGSDCALNPPQNEKLSVSVPQFGNQHLPTQTPKGSPKNQNFETKTSQSKRSPAHAQDHIIAERKRREKLSQSFIALAALVPGLKKMDKASVLGDAIKYVKQLKERLAVLEEQSKKIRAESVVVLNNKPELSGDDDSSSCDESIDADGGVVNESVFEVEARVSGQEMLIRFHCKKQKGILVKLLAEIQSYHLLVVNSSVLPFGDSILDVTMVARMEEDYNLTTTEFVKNLRVAAVKIMSEHGGWASMGRYPQ